MPTNSDLARDLAVHDVRIKNVEEDFREMKDAMKQIASDVSSIRMAMTADNAVKRFMHRFLTFSSGLAGIILGYFGMRH